MSVPIVGRTESLLHGGVLAIGFPAFGFPAGFASGSGVGLPAAVGLSSAGCAGRRAVFRYFRDGTSVRELIQSPDDFFGLVEGNRCEREVLHDPYVVDVVVGESALLFEEPDRFAGVVAVAGTEGEENPGLALAIDVDRADFGVAALAQLVLEGQAQQLSLIHI